MTSQTPTAIRPPDPLELVSFHPAPPLPPSDDVATVVPPASSPYRMPAMRWAAAPLLIPQTSGGRDVEC